MVVLILPPRDDDVADDDGPCEEEEASWLMYMIHAFNRKVREVAYQEVRWVMQQATGSAPGRFIPKERTAL